MMLYDVFDHSINKDDSIYQYVPWLAFGGWLSNGFPITGFWDNDWEGNLW